MFHNVSKVFLCGMPGRRGLFASVSGDDYHFSVQHFGCVHVHVAWHAQNFRRVVLHVFANCIVRAASSGDNVQTRGRCGTARECHFAWQGQYLVQIHRVWISFCMAGAVFRTLYTLHSALCTDTPHSTKLYTPHFTLYTLHSTLYTLHFTLNTLHPALYTPHFTLYTPQLTIYTLHSTLYTPHSRVYTLHSKLYTLHSTLHILHSTLYTLHSTLHNPHFTLYTQHSPLNIPLSSRSTLCTSLPSTFHSVYSALVRQHGNRAQNCSNNLFHNSVLRDCVQVRGLHLVFMEMLAHLEEIIFLDFLWIPWRGWTRRTERALC